MWSNQDTAARPALERLHRGTAERMLAVEPGPLDQEIRI